MFISPVEYSFEGRALQSSTLNKTYSIYEVMKPLPVDTGQAIFWFGYPDYGTQHETFFSIDKLVENGFLRKV
ncbi:TNT domain-containing protein [Pantoea vagans]|uniref:TNT domain-containing protein n=1 Tax=Pantoea vagans TaxID=470934 RepID=UPI003D1742FF